ncbi:UDP-2,4-diacetamido-2,4,6-trideoxy-beta-L-altropyranose hydrolase [Roseobacter litoralis]|uniref:UDP-2,4-diacetamido-2,4, 6-trideoxy-beta-L-altropyranose hydrolase n=1 Tax=Roseobacter litoralis TaxID=42443 RepID=UPI002495471B|nr:UDP-2,4-diacetamido-2,4,6-trideoxy-beta-L-altropyranose hydrolase [Roseobacter litoralis]
MSAPLRVVFRADSSLVIGTGHVMRCLMLARRLREAGADCAFVCADLPGHLGHVIAEWGMAVTMLPTPNAANSDPADYASWSGLPWEVDAEVTAGLLARRPPDWLVVDHYGLDARWECAVAPKRTRCLAIDDLANRSHAASLLVDASLVRQPEAYTEHVPAECMLLLGPQYALLRPEFAYSRAEILPTRSARALQHVLITMGGVDLPNASGAVLEALGALPVPDRVHVTLVLGRTAPHLETVRAQANTLPFSCDVLVDVADMHRLMGAADVAIGAVGGTAWERCVLGLPSLMLSIADNQTLGAYALAQAGAGLYLGALNQAGWIQALATGLAALEKPGALAEVSRAASALCDGRGTERVVQTMLRV